uniref:Uncharacterized protein n=1 Tax=Rhizophora mucronata TaxID=61149 RepID=A0A2P2LH22_RHIMU
MLNGVLLALILKLQTQQNLARKLIQR